ncbi:type II toxin-antitoxin system VapC family toxin [Mongoliitalea lutea]|uniref:Ribonuclease VapC n=1 Tax=Mongoliitalea lutea TaxID=849756 RepID=A0A8J3CZQ1_9BACT|nr:PIN domain nuclease [Mongoliitalea lutea]GHB40817.1 ribonuclease VapC [Mongoliitalea lutea]
MILVDSSVWIDFFNGKDLFHVNKLYDLLGKEIIISGDLIWVEVLQGFKNDSHFQLAKKALESLPYYNLCSKDVALFSAENYRILRKKGVTIRKTIDVIIGSFCIINDIRLLHADRDFEYLTNYLGLKVV